MLQDLAEESKKVGLIMNTSKTKVMTNGKKEKIIACGNHIEYCEEYTYLGQIISPINSMTKEINKRIAAQYPGISSGL